MPLDEKWFEEFHELQKKITELTDSIKSESDLKELLVKIMVELGKSQLLTAQVGKNFYQDRE